MHPVPLVLLTRCAGDLAQLPAETMQLCLEFLEVQDLGRLACTSRAIHRFTDSDYVWARLLRNHFRRGADSQEVPPCGCCAAVGCAVLCR